MVYNYYNNISNIDNRILLSITTHDIPNNYKKETLLYIFPYLTPVLVCLPVWVRLLLSNSPVRLRIQ